ncbi:UNVERIFIED_CONTAM: hypothetical protein Sradi_4539700 [Sesamum radiatum]|uniref:Uncharacterized protein n=1 Tax=Sesamum radiatum TaxID=300843 RepID=A0AAW2N909_SESRA
MGRLKSSIESWFKDQEKANASRRTVSRRITRSTVVIQNHPRFTTGETPFNLVYGSEAVIPAEAEMETFRIHHYEQGNNDSLLRANLDLIEKVQEDACIRAERYKRRVVNAYNR